MVGGCADWRLTLELSLRQNIARILEPMLSMKIRYSQGFVQLFRLARRNIMVKAGPVKYIEYKTKMRYQKNKAQLQLGYN
jgi:hypothetical protein